MKYKPVSVNRSQIANNVVIKMSQNIATSFESYIKRNTPCKFITIDYL